MRKGLLKILEGNNSPESILLIKHRKPKEIGFLELLIQFSKGLIFINGQRFAVHDLAHLYTLHNIHIPALLKSYTPFGKFSGVDGLRREIVGKIGRRHCCEHEGQNECIIITHFKDYEHGGKRGPCTGSKNSCHSYQCIGTWRSCKFRVPGGKEFSHGTTKHGSDKE